ncbi:MFS transporter [Stackebrandtia nassauensis]|uniref:Major facilitator superfamily MFS_1 n=1 Tax=Stackebrandtia nassauensis (strain DSM 44728 / CIP 108903 / NRRL B-16338 / NBRC 102104 / LLR-40K-21) TaxID=446470 RepID=D3Q9P3_STANL|nr:MFS transporter [Stackebrandtia nassauensis]ADD44589.1 major facilitator superfamily MFS_1 [Stackebrandtia nassauensis DSM 44728]
MSASVAKPLGLTGRDFILMMVASLGAFTNVMALLSVVPLWSADAGTSASGVGAITATMMGATVALQLGMGGLLRRFALRHLFAVGALLLGVPTFGYLLSTDLAWVLAVSAVRGFGFGMVTVAGSALAAELVPAVQRGRAIAAYGVAIGVSQFGSLPLAVSMAERIGYDTVFVFTAVAAILAAPAMWAQSGKRVDDITPVDEASGDGVRQRLWAMSGPFTVMTAVACALGGMFTFIPLALTSPDAAAVALLTMAAGLVGARWVSGMVSDRLGPGRMLLPSAAVAAVGMGVTAVAIFYGFDGLAIVGATVYGAGFGGLQNDTLVVMFRRSGPGGHGLASIVWNIAYDGGTGVGGLLIGLLVAGLSLSSAFGVVAIAILALCPLAWRDWRAEHRAAHAKVPTAACAGPG